jgi:hypothetical protein
MLNLRVLLVLQSLLGLIDALVQRDDCVPWQFNAKRGIASVGQTNCRYSAKTGKDVNYFTCTEIAQKYHLTMAELLDLNPELDEKCQGIKPDTDYCVVGCKWIGLSARNDYDANTTLLSPRTGTSLGRKMRSTPWQCLMLGNGEAMLQLEDIHVW